MLSTSFLRADGWVCACAGGSRCTRSALPGGGGGACGRDNDSPLWYGGVGER